MANLKNITDKNYVRSLTDKWLTNVVIPQVYDDSLSYYEEINKILGCLTDITNVIGDYQTELLKEIEERQHADATLQTNIDTVNTNIETEKSVRESADITLQANIDNEIQARENADNVLQANIAGTIKWDWTTTSLFIESLDITDKNNA
nr:MAG TPA: hypothetical protein [Caudoviricetes sp.]